MYTNIESIQILIALLKEYDIRNLVLSAGTRHTPFVRSVEKDSCFRCYSIVDERSAAFFAIGIAQETGEPTVICCTSGTSVCNYTSGVAEAFYARIPLVIITMDRNPYYLNQQEEQMVPQTALLQGICKISVTLPMVKDQKDRWRCNELINEALLELNHHGAGPVHINVPVEEGLFDFSTQELPTVRKINRIELKDDYLWQEKALELSKAKKILVTYGQAAPLTTSQQMLLNEFSEKYGAVFMVDYLANLHCESSVYAYNVTRACYAKLISDMVPDIVIAMNGFTVEIRGWLGNCSGRYQFWNVMEDGNMSDPFRCLTNIFECSAMEFMEQMVRYAHDEKPSFEYLNDWKQFIGTIKLPDLEYSDLYAVEKFINGIPENSLLHIANSNSVRLSQEYPLKESVKVYCNRGTCGIDGSMSTFIGQAYAHDGLCFLLIGDLSFFYDMNGLWSKYLGKNVRIMLNNNGCGEVFYTNKKQDIDTVGWHIAADHNTRAQAWVESRGFTYLSSTNKQEFDENLERFWKSDYDKPVFFEVFTDKYVNIRENDKLANTNETINVSRTVKKAIKAIIGR